jgi:regulator of replication initiation timing
MTKVTSVEDAKLDELCKPFTRPKGAVGRPSKAENVARQAHEDRQRELCAELLDRNTVLEQENGDLHQKLAAARQELAAAVERNNTTAMRADQAANQVHRLKSEGLNHRAAAEIQADLNCMMPGELRPVAKWEPSPSGSTYGWQFENDRGVFRLRFNIGVAKLEVTPSDTSRRPRTVDVSYKGIPDDSVERLIGILGLPADTPIPSQNRRTLRQDSHAAAHDARMLELRNYIAQSLSGVGSDVFLLVDDEAMDAFYGQHPHTENPAR